MIYHLVTLIGIYGMLAVGLNLIVGYTGLFSLGHAAFFGLGAYTSALLSLAGAPVWTGMLAGGMMGALGGWLVGYSTVNLRGDYFCLGTLAFGEITRAVFTNWIGLTRGPMGLPGIPRPSLFGVPIKSVEQYMVLALVFLTLSLVFAERLVKSPFGRVLRSIREDDVAAESLGKNVGRTKIVAVMAGSFLAGVAGGLYAHYITYIDPMGFTLNQSIFILVLVVFGGLGNNYGSIVGAVILVVVREGLRFLGLPSSVSAALQQAIYSVLLIGLMLARPRGLLGEVRFTTRENSSSPRGGGE